MRHLCKSRTDAISLTPENAAGKRRVVPLENQVEAIRNIFWLGNLDSDSRNAPIADQAVHRTVSECNFPGHQYRLVGSSAAFHDFLRQKIR